MKYILFYLLFAYASFNFYSAAQSDKVYSVEKDTISGNDLFDNKYLIVSKIIDEEYLFRMDLIIDVYEKNSNRHLQRFDSINVRNLENYIYVDDYNFDGYDDFPIIFDYHAVHNSSSGYFLFDPETDSYFLSEICGTNLEFNPETKTIFETNTCCAGQYYNETTYCLKDNKMVMIEQRCYQLDIEKSEDGLEYFEIDCDDNSEN